jgi:predicted metal-dependent peptidase
LVIEGEDGVELKIDKNFTPLRSDDVWKDWRAKMMAAAQQCEARGHDMGNYGALLEELSASTIPWKEILRQFLTPIFGGARQWLPPNRRYVSQGIYLPSRRQQELLKIVVAIDTSGSTTGAIVQSFMSEVNAIVNLFGGYEMTLLQIDAGIQDVQMYTMDNPFDPEEFQLMGGGGTKFEPAFDHVKEEMNDDIKVLIYMTDGYGSAPDKPPSYPVLWVLSENGRKPCDWGIELSIPPEN